VKVVNVQPTHEHEWEAAPGLPAPLPGGETVLWQGSPDWRQLALHAFHVRKIGIYFLLMLAIQGAFLMGDGARGGDMWRPLAVSFLTASLGLGMLAGVAWFAGKSTLYTLTNKRVVMRVGIVLTLTFNLPYKRIAAASLRRYGQRSLDIALQLYPQDRIGWFHLWPHQRAWHLSHPQPTLRCLPDGEAVGALLMREWQRVHAAPAQVWAAPPEEALSPAVVTSPATTPAPVRQTRPVTAQRQSGQTQQGLPA
jgi:hypothetical protein